MWQSYTVFIHESLCPYHKGLQVTIISIIPLSFLFLFCFAFSSKNLAKDVSEFTKALKHTIIIAYLQKSVTVPSIIVLQFVLITHVIFALQLSISFLSESVYVIVNATFSCKKLWKRIKTYCLTTNGTSKFLFEDNDLANVALAAFKKVIFPDADFYTLKAIYYKKFVGNTSLFQDHLYRDRPVVRLIRR